MVFIDDEKMKMYNRKQLLDYIQKIQSLVNRKAVTNIKFTIYYPDLSAVLCLQELFDFFFINYKEKI